MSGRPCTVCNHPELAAINKALLVERGSKASVAARFGLTESSVQRHRAGCLAYKPQEKSKPPSVERANPSESVRFDPEAPKSLISTTARLVDEALDLLEHAKKADDRRTALVALREARDGLALLMRTAGMLTGDGGSVVDNRRQTVQLFGKLSVEELRALAAGSVTDAQVES